jgi:hypothetical protein
MKEIILKILDNELIVLIFFAFGILFFITITGTNRSDNLPQIEQKELKIHSLDTINLDNPHISIITIDSVRFLLVHNGKNFDIERFDK